MARIREFDEEDALNNAVNLFWNKGYNATSINDISETLDLSRSSIYGTYGDKRQLYISALKKYRDTMAGNFINAISSSNDVKKILKELFLLTAKDCSNDKDHKGCFMVNTTIEVAPHDKEIAEIVNSNMKNIEDAFFLAIKNGQTSKQISNKHDARALARFFFNNVSGMRVASKSGADKTVFEDVVRVLLTTLD